MIRILRSTATLTAIGAVAAVAIVLSGYDRRDLVGDAYLVFCAFLVALAATRIVARAFAAPRRVVPRALARRPRSIKRVESLLRIEDVVALAGSDAFDLHYRLRPVLQEIAAARVEGEPSPELWSLVRPDRPRPEREQGHGIHKAELAVLVTELERMLET